MSTRVPGSIQTSDLDQRATTHYARATLPGCRRAESSDVVRWMRIVAALLRSGACAHHGTSRTYIILWSPSPVRRVVAVFVLAWPGGAGGPTPHMFIKKGVVRRIVWGFAPPVPSYVRPSCVGTYLAHAQESRSSLDRRTPYDDSS